MADPSTTAEATPLDPDYLYQDDDDNDLDDVFNSADELDDDVLDNPSADLTKSYNRQRQLHASNSQSAAGARPSNTQKPTANTFASVDDQVAELSKHAAKIRLDNVKQSQERDKDKADRATAELVLDERTRMILLQMINRGVVSEIHGAISTGKEANVYGAVLYPDSDAEPIQRAIKIYKTLHHGRAPFQGRRRQGQQPQDGQALGREGVPQPAPPARRRHPLPGAAHAQAARAGHGVPG
jgi:RIO kinase 1